MATLTLGGKTVLTQTGSDEPVLGSNLTGTLGSGITLGSGVTYPSGHILQMKHATRTTSYSDTFDNTWTNIPSLEVDITPFFSTSKILVIANLRAGNGSTSSHNGTSLILRRNIDNAGYSNIGNQIQVNTGDPYSYAITHVLTHIDTPSTNLPVKYAVGYADTVASYTTATLYIGRILAVTTEPEYESVIMAMEIAV